MRYLFVFGNTPLLSKAELDSVLPPFKAVLFKDEVFVLETKEPLAEKIFDLLGGTVKVGIEADLNETVTSDFGISDYTHKINILKLSKEIKKNTGHRYVLPQKGTTLSSVVVRKQKLTELIFTDAGVFKTIWVQDFESWNKRDYDRPEVQAHIGMLPPKVARMMVNIAGGNKILDPFCGVGTVLAEALMVDGEAYGSDIDPRQIERTRKNLSWLGKKAQLWVADARHISEKAKDIDAIVTETYLGPDNPVFLEKLYLDCLSEWRKVLKPGGVVVMAIPFVKNVVDKAIAIGYSLLCGPLEYARPQAKVKRNILVFKYGTH